MRRNQKLIIAILLLASTGPVHAKPELIPVMFGLFSTGQWYFEGERSSLGGNAALTVVPALKFSDRFSLIPTFETNYLGTRSAEELAGGNTLFQDTWETGVAVKGVWSMGRNWKFRSRTGARTKLFRETTDESFTDGLYDYRIYNAGTELERVFGKKISIAAGYDYSFLTFPNYTSLESDQTSDQSREFSGDDVLDANIHLMSLRSGFPLAWDIESSLNYFYSPRNFTDQTVVALSGLLTSTKRTDVYNGGTLSIERLFRPTGNSGLLSTLSYGYSTVDSNQNHYDAQQTTFIADFYDYDENQVSLNLSLGFGKTNFGPMVAEVGTAYLRRDYKSRVIQDAAGVYLSEKLYVTERSLSLGFSYPLARYFRLATSATFGRSKSNNQYEDLYRYNFNNANYQFGFTFEY